MVKLVTPYSQWDSKPFYGKTVIKTGFRKQTLIVIKIDYLA